MDTNVYYKTIFPGYVVQLFTPEQLVEYSSEYLKKYDAYDKNQDIELNRIRKNLMYRYINPKKLLDVGYGLGGFLDSVQLNDPRVALFGYDVTDVEPPTGVTKFDGNFEYSNFDVVTFFDSLEHVPVKDITDYLRRFNTKCFIISVPWFQYNETDKWFKEWKHRRPNEHLHFFDVFGLTKILQELGYKIVHISNLEDSIRPSQDDHPNILTVVALKKEEQDDRNYNI